jgi:SAM-dependent methyltransferase
MYGSGRSVAGDRDVPSVTLLADVGHDRSSYIRSRVEKHHKALEIGGSYNPMFRRSEGYNLYTADHGSQSNLVAKYAASHPGGDKYVIDRVDFIATDGDLNKAIPEEHAGTFDFVLSSHNIEHIPNPIAHLRSVERLLAPDGVFLMVAPDKRGCFDLLRQLTSTGQWLEAYLRPEPFHTPRTRFDCESYSVANHQRITWGNDEVFDHMEIASGLSVDASFAHVRELATEYWDGHAWSFTPHSLLLILLEIQALGLTGLYPHTVVSDGNGEFVVELVRSKPVPIHNTERVRLLALACREQAEAHMRIAVV